MFIIGTHEAAHFLVARFFGVGVIRFSIGFGKVLWRKYDKQGTEYVISLIPLGGYVKMLDETEEAVPETKLAHAFNQQAFYKKFLIVAAGPLTNIFCAFILYWFVFVSGFMTIKPMIGEIQAHSIAAEAGLKPGEEIIAIDGHKTMTWSGVVFRLIAHAGNHDHVSIKTSTATLDSAKAQTDVKTEHQYVLDLSNWQLNKLTPDALSSLGIKPYQALKTWPQDKLRKIQYGPLNAATHALREIYNFTYFNFLFIAKLLTGKLSVQSMGGPIAIFQTAGAAINTGISPFITFIAFFSISIGVINLLPIPGLDGGHLLFQIIELVLRRPIPVNILIVLYRLGFLLILFILFQAIINDVLRLY